MDKFQNKRVVDTLSEYFSDDGKVAAVVNVVRGPSDWDTNELRIDVRYETRLVAVFDLEDVVDMYDLPTGSAPFGRQAMDGAERLGEDIIHTYERKLRK